MCVHVGVAVGKHEHTKRTSIYMYIHSEPSQAPLSPVKKAHTETENSSKLSLWARTEENRIWKETHKIIKHPF